MFGWLVRLFRKEQEVPQPIAASRPLYSERQARKVYPNYFKKPRTRAQTSAPLAPRKEEDDGMPFVTGLVLGSALSHHHDVPSYSPPPVSEPETFVGGGGQSAGGGAGGSWDSDSSSEGSSSSSSSSE